MDSTAGKALALHIVDQDLIPGTTYGPPSPQGVTLSAEPEGVGCPKSKKEKNGMCFYFISAKYLPKIEMSGLYPTCTIKFIHSKPSASQAVYSFTFP